MTWRGTAVLNSGSGTVHLWALIQGTQSGDSLPGTVLPCGISLPDFGAIIGETYGVTFPNSLFDGTFLTAVPGTVTVSSSSPGATFQTASVANLIGIALANPTTAAWPNLATAQADEVDMDMDGNPGVTANPKTGGSYSYPPVTADIFNLQRADVLYMALRSVMSLNGTLTSCSAASGNATVAHLDDHILGCHVMGGSTCTGTQTSFVDSNSPVLAPGTATFSAVQLTNAATCQDVRAALP